MAMWEKKGKTFVACYENIGILKKKWSIVDLQCCVSGVQQTDSVIYTYTYTYNFQILFSYRLLRNIEYSSLCYIGDPHLLFILYIVVCMC